MPSISNRITCEPASSVPAHPTSANFHASGPRFTRNSETIPWLPGGRKAVRSVIRSSRLVRPPIRLVANPTMMSSAGKNARNRLKAIACEIIPQRGNTRVIIRSVRLKREGLEAIARHYTHGRPSAEEAHAEKPPRHELERQATNGDTSPARRRDPPSDVQTLLEAAPQFQTPCSATTVPRARCCLPQN